VASAQQTFGIGSLDEVTGYSEAAIEEKDLFAIRILPGGGISATVTSTPASDSKLYLFDAAGRGLLGDDDSGVSVNAALPLGHPALAPLPEGIYYLGITDYDYLPTSDGGAIFPSGNLVGPSGPGGAQPQSGWTASGHESSWSYSIRPTGAEYAIAVPEPTGLLLGMLATATAIVEEGELTVGTSPTHLTRPTVLVH
jgi:hypothetical protein